MATLNLHNQINQDTVMVSGIFIDEYMPKANGEFVKIYLYLLRSRQKTNPKLSLSHMADIFHLTEHDVLRALSYWEKEGLLRLSFDFNHSLTDITLLDVITPNLPEPVDSSEEFTEPTPQMMENLSRDPNFCELLNIAEIYLKRTVKSTDWSILGYWYLMFHRSYDIIEYLIE